MRKPTNLHDSAPFGERHSADNSSTSLTIVAPIFHDFRVSSIRLSTTILRARDGNYFSSLVAFAFAVTMAPPHAPFILAAYVPVFDRCTQNGTRSQSVDPFTSELSFFAVHTQTRQGIKLPTN